MRTGSWSPYTRDLNWGWGGLRFVYLVYEDRKRESLLWSIKIKFFFFYEVKRFYFIKSLSFLQVRTFNCKSLFEGNKILCLICFGLSVCNERVGFVLDRQSHRRGLKSESPLTLPFGPEESVIALSYLVVFSI